MPSQIRGRNKVSRFWLWQEATLFDKTGRTAFKRVKDYAFQYIKVKLFQVTSLEVKFQNIKEAFKIKGLQIFLQIFSPSISHLLFWILKLYTMIQY